MTQIANTWAKRITTAWSRCAEGIIETGRLLIEAKTALEHGAWQEMVKTALPFPLRTSQRLMEIARDQRLVKASILPLLPDRWTRIHKLHKISDDVEFERRVKDIAPIGGARSIMGSRQEPDDSLDYFPTPPWATRSLIEVVLYRALGERDLGKMPWEPACGEGHIAEVLSEYSPDVIATDIFDYGYGDGQVDFLKSFTVDRDGETSDWIITNPPFGDKTEAFVLRAIELANYGVAMFVRLQWLEGIGRYEKIFREHPPTLVAFFTERVNLCKGRWEPEGSTATAYIWLVWIKGERPQPPFWIPPGQREALRRPADDERFTQHPVRRRDNPETVATFRPNGRDVGPAGATSAPPTSVPAGSPISRARS